MDDDSAAKSMATLTLADLEDDDDVRQIGNVQLGTPEVATEEPETVMLDMAKFWIQVHGVPVGLRSEAVLVRGFIGDVTQLDDCNFDGAMRVFFRILVAVEVSKPLKKGMKLKNDNGEWVKVEFRYERLPTFCFICGLIGHNW
nr:uncharacterized protein LOC109166477 [Ipomoea trifida]